MQKQFFSSLFLTILLNLLVKPIAIFLIDATVQNRVGQAEYGLYFTLLNLTVIFNIFLDFGINNYTTKTIAQNTHNSTSYFGNLMAFRFVLFIIYCVVIFLFALLLGYKWREFYLLLFLVFNQLLILSIAFFRSHFTGLHLFKTDAVISIMDRGLLILIAGSILFVFTNDTSRIEWFIYTQTLCYLLTFFIAIFLLRKKNIGPFLLWDFNFSMSIVKKSLPYALLILLMILYNRSDVVILERFHSNGRVEAGHYAQGFRLLDAVYMFGMIFAGLLYPMFSRLLKESKKEVVDLLKTAGNLLIGGAIVLVIISTFNARWLLSLLYDNVQTTAVFSFCFLIICFIPISMNFIFGTLLTASGRLKTLNIISLFGVLINFTSNALLIPSIGAKGAAISALITQCFVAGIQFYYAYQSIQLNITPKALLNYIYLVAILLLSGFFSMYFGLDHGIAALMQLLLGGLLLFIFSFINLKNIKNMLIIKEETNNYPIN